MSSAEPCPRTARGPVALSGRSPVHVPSALPAYRPGAYGRYSGGPPAHVPSALPARRAGAYDRYPAGRLYRSIGPPAYRPGACGRYSGGPLYTFRRPCPRIARRCVAAIRTAAYIAPSALPAPRPESPYLCPAGGMRSLRSAGKTGPGASLFRHASPLCRDRITGYGSLRRYTENELDICAFTTKFAFFFTYL